MKSEAVLKMLIEEATVIKQTNVSHKFVTVHLEDGNVIKTRMNGSEKTIRDYYGIGQKINMGTSTDIMVKIVKVDVKDAD